MTPLADCKFLVVIYGRLCYNVVITKIANTEVLYAEHKNGTQHNVAY